MKWELVKEIKEISLIDVNKATIEVVNYEDTAVIRVWSKGYSSGTLTINKKQALELSEALNLFTRQEI